MPVTKEELITHEITQFFLKTNYPEIVSLFNLLTDSYLIANDDHAKEDKANIVSLINSLKDLITSIELIRVKGERSENVFIEGLKKCKNN